MTFYDRLTSNRDTNPRSVEIRKLFKSDKDSFIVGLTKVSIDFDILKIQHSGRDFHTMLQLNANLIDSGLIAIERLKEHFFTLSEMGHPNYFYVVEFQL